MYFETFANLAGSLCNDINFNLETLHYRFFWMLKKSYLLIVLSLTTPYVSGQQYEPIERKMSYSIVYLSRSIVNYLGPSH